MKLTAKDYLVEPGARVDLGRRPTRGPYRCRSKARYRALLAEHVARLSELQELLYASHRTRCS